MRWVAETKLLGIALYVGRGLTHQAENTTRPETNWKFAESFGKLIDSKEFNNALEFSLVAAGMCEDDQPPKGWNSPAEGMSPDLLEHFKDLNARDPKRFKLSIESEISKLMHPRAYEATATTEGVLMVKAQKLSLNMLPVTPANLARELGISIAKLRGQYGREAVRRACAPSPTREESSKRVRYQLG